jgi:hypothetical protein
MNTKGRRQRNLIGVHRSAFETVLKGFLLSLRDISIRRSMGEQFTSSIKVSFGVDGG